jgi:hypothetical protein
MAGDSSASQHLLLKWKGVHETGSTPGFDSFVELIEAEVDPSHALAERFGGVFT